MGLKGEHVEERNLNFIMAIFLLVLLVPILTKFFFAYSEKKASYEAKLHQKRRLEAELKRLQDKNNSLKERKAFLNTPEGIEEVARRKLGMVKENEISFIVKEEQLSQEIKSSVSKKEKELSKRKSK